MSLNCKPGDIAIVVGIASGVASNTKENKYGLSDFGLTVVDMRGVVVKCVSSFNDGNDIVWNVEPQKVSWRGIMHDGRSVEATGDVSTVPDSILKPIRDPDGEDETLTWKPVPSTVTA